MRVLILGGTTEAGALARALAERGVPAIYSYAGRTMQPAAQPVPVRIGGFGGVEGLADAMAGFTHVVDATHPFARQISAHARLAAARAGVDLLRLTRAPWVAGPGDDWREVADEAAAAAALPKQGERVFLALGKQHLAPFAGLEHAYLLRLVDPPQTPPLANAHVVVDRGPFTQAGDLALLREHRITWVVARNSGGAGARAKLDAARALGLPVVMIARPDGSGVFSVQDVLDWLGLK